MLNLTYADLPEIADALRVASDAAYDQSHNVTHADELAALAKSRRLRALADRFDDILAGTVVPTTIEG